ncbi:MAG: biotin--[acetyl-CoA-carboxylase] ligase [Saprospiraceae bacterium]
MDFGAYPMHIGHHRIILDTIHSTQDFAAAMLKDEPDLHGILVQAHHQTHGRGRWDKKWSSEPGLNFTGSFILQLPVTINRKNHFLVSMVASLAVRSALQNLVDKVVLIKWPNDIIINYQKIAGILTQYQWQGDRPVTAIVGIGININQVNFDNVLTEASSIKKVMNMDFDFNLIINTLLSEWNILYKSLINERYHSLISLYQEALYGFGKEISFLKADILQKGILREVLPDGRLCIQVDLAHHLFDIDQIKIVYI